MVSDPISDMFTRIKNSSAVKKPTATFPYSKLKMEVAKLLETRGVVGGIARKGKKNRRSVEIDLLYDDSGNPAFSEIIRVSKPSRRIYVGWRDLKSLKGGLGFYIISTSEGIIDDKQAKKIKVGGEIVGKVW